MPPLHIDIVVLFIYKCVIYVHTNVQMMFFTHTHTRTYYVSLIYCT